MPPAAVNELIDVFQAQTTEDKHRMALVDLLRLLVLKDNTANYILGKHWGFIKTSIMDHLMKQDLTNAMDKTLHNFHYLSLKFLTNCLCTDLG